MPHPVTSNISGLRYGAFAPAQVRLGQEVGRMSLIDCECTVHAIRLHPSSILGTIVKVAGIGRLLARILYGSYTYQNIHGEDFLVSERSAKGAILQRLALGQIDAFKQSAPCDERVEFKLNRLRAEFIDNKEPFRKLVRYPTRPYLKPDEFVITYEESVLKIIINNGLIGKTKETAIKSAVNITEKKMETWSFSSPLKSRGVKRDDNYDFSYMA